MLWVSCSKLTHCLGWEPKKVACPVLEVFEVFIYDSTILVTSRALTQSIGGRLRKDHLPNNRLPIKDPMQKWT
eukprot:scaffold5622_cov129-Cylindrotheca_fusiformis.AAC.3